MCIGSWSVDWRRPQCRWNEVSVFTPEASHSGAYVRNVSSVYNWEKVRGKLLEATVEEEGMPESGVCVVCIERELFLRCRYCGPRQFFCPNFARDLHANRNQFHVTQLPCSSYPTTDRSGPGLSADTQHFSKPPGFFPATLAWTQAMPVFKRKLSGHLLAKSHRYTFFKKQAIKLCLSTHYLSTIRHFKQYFQARNPLN